jgi:hypothetical protein
MGLGTALVVVTGILCGTGLLISLVAIIVGNKSGILGNRKSAPKGIGKTVAAIEERLQSQQSEIHQLQEDNRFLRGLLENRSSEDAT